MIKLIDIVYCFVSKTIPFQGDVSILRESFVNNGFSEKEIAENSWKYKRGASLGLDFKYSSSEALEIQVFLKLEGDQLTIKVGNWGFPFEPLLMKKRFIRSLNRFTEEISSNGSLIVNTEEITSIEKQAKNKFKHAVIIIAVIVLITLYDLITAK